MRSLAVVIVALVVSNCGGAHQSAQDAAIAAAWQKTHAAIAECDSLKTQGSLKTRAQSVGCSNPRILAAWQEAGYPYMDLLMVYTAARLVGAENADKGKITDAQLGLQLAELQTRLVAEDQRRKAAMMNATAQAQAARAQSAAAMLQGLAAFQASQNMNRPVNCTTTGPYGVRTTTCF